MQNDLDTHFIYMVKKIGSRYKLWHRKKFLKVHI